MAFHCGAERWLCDHWELNSFTESVHEQLHQKGSLSPKQHAAIERYATREDDSKQLWRSAMKLAHPDLGRDDGDRMWRTRFSKFANEAYERADTVALRWIITLLGDDDATGRP